MQFSGLSIDQAPPISAPMRFFLTAPLFGVLFAAALFFVDTQTLFSVYTGKTVALVHLFTIGMLTMVIMGAIQQMLPVLAGVNLPRPKLLASITHLFLLSGTLLFCIGFYFELPMLLHPAGLLLLLAFAVLFSIALMMLRKVVSLTPTIKAMRIAMFAAIVTAILGVMLVVEKLLGGVFDHFALLSTHIVFGVIGFGVILVIGVAFQVIPMFYVTKGFKKFCTRRVVLLIFSGVLLWSLSNFLYPEGRVVVVVILTLFLTAFPLATVKKLYKRRRPTSDVSLRFWYTGLTLLFIAALVWSAQLLLEQNFDYYTGLLFGISLASLLSGMLYKIVPFLVWFHLNALGYFSIPMMREMIADKNSNLQFYLFMSASIVLFIAPIEGFLVMISALLYFLSFALLYLNLYSCMRIYQKTVKLKPDFEMA